MTPRDDDNGNDRRRILSASTLVPLGAVATVFVAMLAGYAWMSDRFHAIESSIGDVRYDLKTMQAGIGDRWTGTDMRLWTLTFKNQNPSINVPEPFHGVTTTK